MILALGEDTVGSLAAAVISAVATVVGAFLGFRASHRETGETRRRDRPHAPSPGEHPKIVAVRVHAEVYRRARRMPWVRGMIVSASAAILGLAVFGYSMYRYTAGGFTTLWWPVVGAVGGAPGGWFLGTVLAMRQIGFDRAGRHMQKIHLDGGLDLVLERTYDALRRIGMGVRSVDVTAGQAVVEASSLTSLTNLSVWISTAAGGTCDVEVTCVSQPKATSFRNNARHVARFLTELTGVELYPASFVGEAAPRDGR